MPNQDGKEEDESDQKQKKTKRRDYNDTMDDTSKKWSETCIGVWTRSTEGHDPTKKTEMVCTGINLVRIGNELDASKVVPSQTRGIQITITETSLPADSMKDEDVGTDGVIGYRPPLGKNKSKLKDNPGNQATPLENLKSYYGEKSDKFKKRIDRYTDDPAQMTELWGDFLSGSKKQYETAKRLLSYCKPKDKIQQMYNFASERVKNLQTWIDESKKGKG